MIYFKVFSMFLFGGAIAYALFSIAKRFLQMVDKDAEIVLKRQEEKEAESESKEDKV